VYDGDGHEPSADNGAIRLQISPSVGKYRVTPIKREDSEDIITWQAHVSTVAGEAPTLAPDAWIEPQITASEGSASMIPVTIDETEEDNGDSRKPVDILVS
jgi:hypothetical protein